jgi:pimeloyl-ACP methyl ester carboxylesterase
MHAPVILLPGIIQPAMIRYAPLVQVLGGDAFPKELEIYATPGSDYAIANEVTGIDRFADGLGLSRFHLYGHSGGGACALAYVAARPERVLTLAVDEPASDFTPRCADDPLFAQMRNAMTLPDGEQIRRFLVLQLADGETPPPPPPGPPPDWFASRPAGIRTFLRAVMSHTVDPSSYASFDRPVLFTHGGRSSAFWDRMAVRLAVLFPSFRVRRWPTASHLATSHQIDPAGVADALRELWSDRST